MKAIICKKTVAYGKNRYKIDINGNWQVLMYGSHGPNDPPVGLSYKWYPIPKAKVPNKVKEEA